MYLGFWFSLKQVISIFWMEPLPRICNFPAIRKIIQLSSVIVAPLGTLFLSTRRCPYWCSQWSWHGDKRSLSVSLSAYLSKLSRTAELGCGSWNQQKTYSRQSAGSAAVDSQRYWPTRDCLHTPKCKSQSEVAKIRPKLESCISGKYQNCIIKLYSFGQNYTLFLANQILDLGIPGVWLAEIL